MDFFMKLPFVVCSQTLAN